mmetsp:Transcript_24403/g.51981  ORF Transcript_24403/g.51981 Transcript_24403/m.51981 type:complete len:81 (-) Transcript_24403:22-264(-)
MKKVFLKLTLKVFVLDAVVGEGSSLNMKKCSCRRQFYVGGLYVKSGKPIRTILVFLSILLISFFFACAVAYEESDSTLGN